MAFEKLTIDILQNEIYKIYENFSAEYDGKRAMAIAINPEKNQKYLDELVSIHDLMNYLNCLSKDKKALKIILKEKIEKIELTYIDRIDGSSSESQILHIDHSGNRWRSIYVYGSDDYHFDWTYSPEDGLESMSDRHKKYKNL